MNLESFPSRLDLVKPMTTYLNLELAFNHDLDGTVKPIMK